MCACYLHTLQIAQNKALRALQFKNRYYPTNQIHENFQINKVLDIVEYELTKSIYSLLTGTPKLLETLYKLLLK